MEENRTDDVSSEAHGDVADDTAENATRARMFKSTESAKRRLMWLTFPTKSPRV